MFIELKSKIQTRFAFMIESNPVLFDVRPDKDHIWELYLNSFPEGEIRQGNDCNCCKSFLRQWAGIVTIKNNKLLSIWDIEDVPEEYKEAVRAIHQYIHLLKIEDVFMNSFPRLGTDQNRQTLESGSVITWNHFYLYLPKNYVHTGSTSIESIQGEKRDNKSVLERSLNELKQDVTETVLELITQGSLYRGNEFKPALEKFLKLQKEYALITDNRQKDNFCWLQSVVPGTPCRIRNNAIGTLLINLSEGMELDHAVRAYESVVAPSNYQRTTALVTPKMREDAKKKIGELGYGDSLFRRFAVSTDLDVNNLLFTSQQEVATSIDPFAELAKSDVIDPKKFGKIEEVHIDDFIKNILPTTRSIELFLENQHLPNFCSLIAPQVSTAKNMFKWNNQFTWAYTGGITDSMKERVKAAGGKVDGVLRFSIQWNEDGKSICDHDAHAYEPDRTHIYYSSSYRKDKSNGMTKMTGQLDVDMIRPSGIGIENITWSDKSKMQEGVYAFSVHQFDGGRNNGFTAQIEFEGRVYDFSYPRTMRKDQFVQVAEVVYSKEKGFTLIPKLEASSTLVQKTKYHLKTNQFHKVNYMMLSPNFWNDQTIGNKHFMFMIDNCIADESVRPFFPEYLNKELYDDRKVFDLLGDVLKVEPNLNQLSGLGFSDTQRNSITIRVKSNLLQRLLKINF